MANVDVKPQSEEKSKRGVPVSTLLIIVLLLVIIGGGVYVFLGRQSAPAPAVAAAPAAPAPQPVELGAVIRLEPIFINLRDGRLLKLGLALQTTQEEVTGVDGALALDAAIEVFSDQDFTQLTGIERRRELKQVLVDRVVDGYGPTVTNIYFTEFVMQ